MSNDKKSNGLTVVRVRGVFGFILPKEEPCEQVQVRRDDDLGIEIIDGGLGMPMLPSLEDA